MKNTSLPLLLITALLLEFAVPTMSVAQDSTDTIEIIHDEDCAHGQQADSGQAVPATTVDPTAPDPTEPVAADEVVQQGWLDILFSGKYLAFLIVALAGIVLLLGNRINLWLRIAFMVLAFVLFGIDQFYPLHPSPMCAVTKLFMFKFTWGKFFPGFIAIFVAIFLPSLIGRKLFCGWVCPLGAFQELVNKIPFPKKYKQFNFTAFNAVRGGLFLMFFLIFFAVKDLVSMLGERTDADLGSNLWIAFSSFSIYDPINFFELLHWSPDFKFWIMISVLIVASLTLYRPFCYAVCPIGFLSWILEKVAPGRIRIDMSKCNQCGICVAESPCPTIAPMIDPKSRVLPDCTSCGECLNTCPKGAIKFGFTPNRS